MSDKTIRPKESTGRGEKRRNPRFPRSRSWTDEEREAHRRQRDMTIEDAGLVTDRMLDEDGNPVD